MKKRNLTKINLIKNDEGFSIVTVIVAIGFALVLASALMMTATVTFKMRNANVYSKDSFYSAEQVIDEINVGLQQIVSDGLSQAYTEVLLTYDDTDYTADQKNEMVKGKFYSYIEEKLCVPGTSGKYIVMPSANQPSMKSSEATGLEGLYGFLKESTRWHDASGDINASYGAFLRASGNNTPVGDYYLGTMTETKNEGIILKDLIVYYKDSTGLISEIKTDIRIKYPGFRFSDSKVPEISRYCFITDTKFTQKGSGDRSKGTFSTTIKGNSYAYTMDLSGVSLEYKSFGEGNEIEVVASEMDVVNGGIKSADTTELWAEDIVAKSSNVELSGQTYIADDLNLKGDSSKLTLKGYYTGYGNSTKASEYSSAILVNGTNSILDFQYIKKLSLAGRSFLAVNNDTKKSTAEKEGISIRESDKATVKTASKIANGESSLNNTQVIYTGESISAKSNQLMYLVPAECIGVDAEGHSKFNANPITKAQQNDIQTEMTTIDGASVKKWTEVSLTKNITKLGNTFNLAEFVATKADGTADFETVNVRSKDGKVTYVYYYLKFKDDVAANTFFIQYYGNNQAEVDNYMKKYIKAIDFASDVKNPADENYSMSLAISTAGNIVADDDTDKRFRPNQIRLSEYDDESGMKTVEKAFEDEAKEYDSQFKALSSKLTKAWESLEDSDVKRDGDNKALYKNLIDEKICEEVANGNARTYFKMSDEAVALLINASSVNTKVELNASDMKCCLIIANCGVKIASGISYKGTIIAKGEIEVYGSNFDFIADPKSVNKAMAATTEDGVYKVSDLFAANNTVSYLSQNSRVVSNLPVADLVEYENWTKNVKVGE